MAFVRLQGCPFRCTWCDSAYTWDNEGGKEMSLLEILTELGKWPTRKACITGGEPLAHPRDLRALAHALNERDYWIEVETAGGHRLPFDLPIDCWVMDVKCPESGMEEVNKYDQLGQLRAQDQLKFVVANRRDFDFALDVLEKHPTKSQVLFSPVWGLEYAEIAEWVKDEAPLGRLSLQLHKFIWEPNRRGV